MEVSGGVLVPQGLSLCGGQVSKLIGTFVKVLLTWPLNRFLLGCKLKEINKYMELLINILCFLGSNYLLIVNNCEIWN